MGVLQHGLSVQLVGVVGDADGGAQNETIQPGLFIYFAKCTFFNLLSFLLLALRQIPYTAAEDYQKLAISILHQTSSGIYLLVFAAEFAHCAIRHSYTLLVDIYVGHCFLFIFAKLMLPSEFINNMTVALGPEMAGQLFDALAREPEVSVRVNPFKMSLEALREHFGPIAGEPVEWAAQEAFYLTERPSFTLDPLFHAGGYYVQEASSMYVGVLFDRALAMLGASGNKGGLAVLDLCAAPGGKTTQLLSHLPSDSLLVANETVPQRATILAENVARWGCPNVVVTNNDPSSFRNERFDIVVVDAPCSGEGMFRKDSSSVREWSPDNVKFCVGRQRRILSDIWPALPSGGFMIYSTCTFNADEDEGNVGWVCSQFGAECIEMRHFYPGRERGEGFFCSLIQKR